LLGWYPSLLSKTFAGNANNTDVSTDIAGVRNLFTLS